MNVTNIDQLCARETPTDNDLNKEDIYFVQQEVEAGSLECDFCGCQETRFLLFLPPIPHPYCWLVRTITI